MTRLGILTSSSLLVLVLGLTSPAFAAGDPSTASSPSELEEATAATPADSGEIVVTATRRNEFLSRVPLSVAAFDQGALDRQGLKDVRDLNKVTSNLQISKSATGGSANTNIAIRGIASAAGTATTGIYIDDTPIQVRRNGYTSRNFLPTLFDLDHVEVLRGPQGTLFGAGSEGGALRFITPSPSLTTATLYSRAEIATTAHGDPSFEAGVAFGIPIVEDRLGIRVSGFVRRDGGYINRVDYFTKEQTEANADYQVSKVFRAALTWQPVDDLKITPSFLYNELYYNDSSAYWLNSSDPAEGKFVTENQIRSPNREKFYLPALKIEARLGGVDIISNTSYFHRISRQTVDYTQLDVATGGLPIGVDYPEFQNLPNPDYQNDSQKIFTQELRLQKTDPDGTFNYTFGVFYSSAKQFDSQADATGQLESLYIKYYGLDFVGLFGVPAYDGLYSYVNEVNTTETQIAGFGQIDFRPTPKLTLTAGVRYTHGELKYYEFVGGPFAFPGGVTEGVLKYNPITPKFGVTYRPDPDTMFYANVAKGFRPGGVQARVPGLACAASLAALGLTESPATYDDDSVWSYEAGAKLKKGGLRLDLSAFYIKWSNIQQTVPLDTCATAFTSNLGSATSKGLDLLASLDLSSQLSLGLSIGYTDARFDSDERSGGTLIVGKGDRVVRIPFTGSANVQYRFTVGERPAYLRGDYQFNGGGTTPNKLAQGYLPQIPNLPATHLVNLRAGISIDKLNASLFVNNLLDAAPQTLTAYTGRSPLIYGITERPRTVGLTLTYAY